MLDFVELKMRYIAFYSKILVVCMSIFSIVSLHAQSYKNAEFVPSHFIPGQAVTMSVHLNLERQAWHEDSLTFGVTNTASNVSILQASIKEHEGAPLLSVRFISWQAGYGDIPVLKIGGIETEAVRFDCKSSLDNDDKPELLAMPQLEPNNFYFYLYIIVGLILLLLLGLVILLTKTHPFFKELMSRLTVKASIRKFEAMLNKLEESIDNFEPSAWSELCKASRHIAGVLLSKDFTCLTTHELDAQYKELVSILSMGDDVRFGGKRDIDIKAGVILGRLMLNNMTGRSI